MIDRTFQSAGNTCVLSFRGWIACPFDEQIVSLKYCPITLGFGSLGAIPHVKSICKRRLVETILMAIAQVSEESDGV